MADEIINAGRFDQQTTHAERRETLEKIMQEQEAGAYTGPLLSST